MQSPFVPRLRGEANRAKVTERCDPFSLNSVVLTLALREAGSIQFPGLAWGQPRRTQEAGILWDREAFADLTGRFGAML